MKKSLITIIISIACGFFLAMTYIEQYDSPLDIVSVFGEQSKTVYLIQQGVYSSFESMENNTSSVSDYVYSVIDGMYYVYIGMTLSENNATKLKEHFDLKGMSTYVKENAISDDEFISNLEHYDLIISETSDEATIDEVMKSVLSEYKGG